MSLSQALQEESDGSIHSPRSGGRGHFSIEIPRDPSGPDLRRAIEATGRRITVFECNIKDHQSIKETFAAIWKSGVVPDILVNCAGI